MTVSTAGFGFDQVADLASASLSSTRDEAGAIRDASSAAEAGQQIERLFARLLIQEMRESLPEGGLLGSQGLDMWTDLLDEELADRIAESGGLGLADHMTALLEHRYGADQTHRPAAPQARVPVHGPGSFDHVVEGGRLTSRFGHRADPFHRHEGRHHAGIDLAAPEGTPIRSLDAGEVVFAGHRGGYGHLVIVRGDDGTETRYAHCAQLEVATGDRVDRGATVGTVGSTGRSTGPHLHLEVRVDGSPVDPLTRLAPPPRHDPARSADPAKTSAHLDRKENHEPVPAAGTTRSSS